jgi:hypothetical protein
MAARESETSTKESFSSNEVRVGVGIAEDGELPMDIVQIVVKVSFWRR